ncbi:MAG: VCBS repeat-containing protein, partial [Caldilinea sp.]|nr:VCBS repeat-containing protein [Caldilinea sp.]
MTAQPNSHSVSSETVQKNGIDCCRAGDMRAARWRVRGWLLAGLLAVVAVLGLAPTARAQDPALTDHEPITNSVSAPLDSSIVLTYSAVMSETTITSRTIAIHSMMQGLVTGTHSVDGAVVTVDPPRAFFPGEPVYAVATAQTTDINGLHAAVQQWQFNAAVTRGNGRFDSTGREFGADSNDSYSVALGDVDGDGDLDAAMGSFGYQNAVYLNNGDGTFGPTGSTFGTGDDYTAVVALGDMDGDGDLDVAVANYDEPFQNAVYLNNGDGTFDPIGNNFGTGNDATYTMALGDVDGDGDLDIAVGNWNQPNVVYLNTGDGTFAASGNTFGTGTDYTTAVALGDLDGDGDLDVAVGNKDNPNVVYFNNGDGSFDPSGSNFGTGTDATFSLELGDVDGDGDLDIAVGNNVQQNVVYLNNGNGAFDPTGNTFGPSDDPTWRAALGDIDGDGDLDAVTGTAAENIAYLNEPPPPIVTSFNPDAYSVSAPLDSNVVLTYSAAIDAATVTSRTVSIHSMMQGQIAGAYGVDGAVVTIDPPRDFFPGELVYAINTTQTADITGTHTAARQWQFNAAVNGGHGGFVSGEWIGADSASTWTMALGDMDGDGDLDAIVGNYGNQNGVFLNNGDGTFDPTGNPFGTSSDYTAAVAVGDLDGDGDLDVAVGNSEEQNAIYLNNGDGSFAASGIDFGTGDDYTYAMVLGDVDGDGDLDIAVGNWHQQNVVYLNNGDGTFAASGNTFGTGSDYTTAVALGDLDGDGDLDMAVGNYEEQNAVYLNSGDGTFAASGNEFGTGDDATYSVELGDVDGDGDLDIAAGNRDQQNAVYLNNSDGTFDPTGNSFGPTDDATWRAALGDIDGDGDLDVTVANAGQPNAAYLNNGDGTFAVSGRDFGAGANVVALGDIDGDGDLDAVTGTSARNIAYRNEPCASNPVVRTTSDSGFESLRWAVAEACPGATVTFGLSDIIPSTITLSSSQIEITKPITISGLGMSILTISGNDTNRIFSVGAPTTIDNLSMTNGFTDVASGGAIYATAPLTLSWVTMADNRSDSGSALYTTDALTVDNCVLFRNSGVSDDGVTVIAAGGRTLLMDRTSFTANIGTALLVESIVTLDGTPVATGPITITNSSFASGDGVAIEIELGSPEGEYTSTDVSIGAINVLSNTFTISNSDGLNFGSLDVLRLTNSAVTVSDINVVGNSFSGGDNGIDWGSGYFEDLWESTITVGAVNILNNDFTNNYTAILLEDAIGFYSMFTSTVSAGDVTIIGNTISGYEDLGIVLDPFFSVSDWGGSSAGSFGNLAVSNNSVNTEQSASNAIVAQYVVPRSFYDTSDITVGDMLVEENAVGGGDASIDVTIGGSDLYNDASVALGTTFVQSNTIATDGAGLAVAHKFAYDVYDNSRAEGAGVVIANNTITATGSGIDLLFYAQGYDGNGNSLVSIAPITITGNLIATGGNGVYINYDSVADYMYDSARSLMAPVAIADNLITSADHSIRIDRSAYDNAAGTAMEGNSYARLPDHIISGNVLNPADGNDGIYVYDYYSSFENYGDSTIDYGQLMVDDNTFAGGRNGFYHLNEGASYENDDNHTVIFSNTVVTDNRFYSQTGTALYFDIDDAGYTHYGNLVFGDTLVARNVISDSDYGIRYDNYEPCYECYDDASLAIGALTIADNQFYAIGTDAINVAIDEVGYSVDPGVTIDIGDAQSGYAVIIQDNTVDGCGDDGIYGYAYISAPDNTTMGRFGIFSNTVTACANGIRLGTMHPGAEIANNQVTDSTSTGLLLATADTDVVDVTGNAIASSSLTDTVGIQVNRGQVNLAATTVTNHATS